MSKVIRVGFVGLSSDASQGTSWGSTAHLPYLSNTPKYRIVALQNSTAEKAQQAIQHYKLPSDVKAYGTAEELANDPDVDLVVISIRVDRHASAAIPAIRAGKDVYIEWPLEANLAKAKELSDLVKKHNVNSISGLQGAFTPAVQQVKQLVASKRIGKVLSSTYVATIGRAEAAVPSSVEYFIDREVGGNIFTIFFGHTLEWVEEVLGPVKTSKSLLSVQRPIVDLVNNDGSIAKKGVKRTSPSHIVLLAKLESEADLVLELRDGPSFPGTPTLEWRIQGTTGEIRVTHGGRAISLLTEDLKIEVGDYKSGEVENVSVVGNLPYLDLAVEPAANIARIYEDFWEHKFNGGDHKYRDFEHTIKRLELIDQMYKDFDAEQSQK